MEKWGSVSGPLFCVRTDVGAEGAGTQKFGLKKLFPPIIPPPPPPHLSSQNDQRDVGVILSHRCWVDDPPPPPARQVGHPRPEPPLPSRRPRRGWGLGKWASVSPPPPPARSRPPGLVSFVFFGARNKLPARQTHMVTFNSVTIQTPAHLLLVPLLHGVSEPDHNARPPFLPTH